MLVRNYMDVVNITTRGHKYKQKHLRVHKYRQKHLRVHKYRHLFNTNFISKAVKRVKCGERHKTF
jgi:hypothetical protein